MVQVCVCVCAHVYVLCHMFSCVCWCVVYPDCMYNHLAFFGRVHASMCIYETLIQLPWKTTTEGWNLTLVSFISSVKPQSLSHFSAQLCLLLQNIDFLLGKHYMVGVKLKEAINKSMLTSFIKCLWWGFNDTTSRSSMLKGENTYFKLLRTPLGHSQTM